MRLLAALTTAAWLATGFSASAQISTEAARRLGLEVAWESQVQMPRTKGIASAHLWADSNGARQFAIVEVNGRSVRTSADELNRDGKPIGLEAAKLKAQQQAQFIGLDTNADGYLVPAEVANVGRGFSSMDRDLDGKISATEHARFIDWVGLITSTLGKKDADRMLASKGLTEAAQAMVTPTGFEVKEQTIPNIKLVLISENGSVETLDAETGRTIWANTCGDSSAPAFPGAVSKAGVVVVHGGQLYLLDWQTGKHLAVKQLQHASSNAVAVTDTTAFVSDFSGRVESYPIGKTDYIQRWGYVIRGRAIGNTVNLLDKGLCGIASADGYFYVFSAVEKPEIWLRYQSTTRFEQCLGVGNDAFYVGNVGGRLSKVVILDRLGKTAWEFLSGQAFATPPLIVGSQVFAATDDGVLNCIDDAEGTEVWMSNSAAIREPLAVANNVVYSRTAANQIIGLDTKNGNVVGTVVASNLGLALMNQLTDRLYLIGQQGQLECLRPIGGEVPKLTAPVVISKATEDKPPVAPPTETPMEENANPFGGDAAPGDPFGGSDPFGGAAPAGGATADPFGSGM